MKKIFFFISLFFFIQTVNASYPLSPIGNWTNFYTDDPSYFSWDVVSYPDRIKHGCPDYGCFAVGENGYLSQNVTFISSTKLNITMNLSVDCIECPAVNAYRMDFFIFDNSTSVCGYTTSLGETSKILICSYTFPAGSYNISIRLNDVIMQHLATTTLWVSDYSGESTTFTALGTVTYIDVDNSTAPLENAFVMINATLFDYTDASGAYSIPGVPNGAYTISVNKSIAFSTASGTTSNSSSTRNFQLRFSNPSMGSPYISTRNTISGVFVHSFKPINLWEEPAYVWGEYYYLNSTTGNYSEIPYYKPCTYFQLNVFECQKVETVYQFRFNFSDIYNENLTAWHPTLTGSRSFTSDYIYIGTAPQPTTVRIVSHTNSTAKKEEAIRVNFWDALLITLALIAMIILGGINDRT